MSSRRPSHRDKLETAYLALARERMEAMDDYDRRLLAMQRNLDNIETPRLSGSETGKRQDALDFVPAARAVTATEERGDDEAPIASEQMDDGATDGDGVDYRARCARMTAVAVGIARHVAYCKRNPRLQAFACLFALGVDCESMRTVAEKHNVSQEWVSQLSEEVRIRFNLPKNQHNKPAEAVRKYKAISDMRGNKSI